VGMILCANRLGGLEDVKAALRHELVHAYDICAARKDLTRCTELAYSEVRAAREAECRTLTYEIYGQWLGLARVMRDSCVRDNATRATQSLFPGPEGATCVANQFESAMASALAPEVESPQLPQAGTRPSATSIENGAARGPAPSRPSN
jgi:hypothetical protein